MFRAATKAEVFKGERSTFDKRCLQLGVRGFGDLCEQLVDEAWLSEICLEVYCEVRDCLESLDARFRVWVQHVEATEIGSKAGLLVDDTLLHLFSTTKSCKKLAAGYVELINGCTVLIFHFFDRLIALL